MAQLFSIHPDNPQPRLIRQAAEIVRSGGVIVYPTDRWLILRVMRQGDPRQQKEILAQRDEINRKLAAIKEALLQEKRGVYKVKQETRNQPELPREDAERVKQLQQDNRASEKAHDSAATRRPSERAATRR